MRNSIGAALLQRAKPCRGYDWKTSVVLHLHENDVSFGDILWRQPEERDVALGMGVVVGDGAARHRVGALHLEEAPDPLLRHGVVGRDEETFEGSPTKLN